MSDQQTPLRVLYIYPDTMGPFPEPTRNALHHLRGHLRGDMIPIFVPGGEGLREIVAQTRHAIGDFAIHPVNTQVRTPVVRQLIEVYQMLSTARRLRREGHHYDAIIAHGPYRTGYVGLILSRWWKLPLVVEFPGHPTRGIALDGTRRAKLKARIAPLVLRALLKRTAGIRLLYPTQLDDVPGLPLEALRRRFHVFHDFVPINGIHPSAEREQSILFVGFPWFLKGVDVLIKAFQQISPEFPNATLRIVGYCPDRTPWDAMVDGNPRIELHGPMPNTEVARLMSISQLFVLPSRTEAMGRVLLEAMAAGAAVIGSRVDGIPYYIEHGVSGLTFEREDVDGLANAMRQLLANPALRQQYATTAGVRVRDKYSEIAYAEAFHRTVAAACEAAVD